MREREGIEWERVGHMFVGGSYLPFSSDQSDLMRELLNALTLHTSRKFCSL